MLWNFELTLFKLTVHFKHELLGIWQRFYKKFELVELQFNHVGIKHAQPVLCN